MIPAPASKSTSQTAICATDRTRRSLLASVPSPVQICLILPQAPDQLDFLKKSLFLELWSSPQLCSAFLGSFQSEQFGCPVLAPCTFTGPRRKAIRPRGSSLKVANRAPDLSGLQPCSNHVTPCFLICKMGTVPPAHLLVFPSTDGRTESTVGYKVHSGDILMDGG